jgi:hypothetical protein
MVDGDPGSASFLMHSCPDGMGMTGFHQARNLLACAPFSRNLAQLRYPDPVDRWNRPIATQRSGMHACPTGLPVSGIDPGDNVLLCGSSGATQDNGTQRHGMHSCPVSTYVIGVDVPDNKLICAAGEGSTTYTAAQEWIDSGTQMQGMHACPVDSAITGVNVGSNLLTCAPYWGSTRFIDGWTSLLADDTQMHACPTTSLLGANFPATGLHVDRDLLLCGSGPLTVTGEFLDAATLRNGTRSCPAGTFMTGEHQARDLLLCSSAFPNQGGEYLDRATQVFGSTHGCPSGYAMTGANVAANVFSCARTTAVATGTPGYDAERRNMLACDLGKPMFGLNASLNWAACGVH